MSRLSYRLCLVCCLLISACADPLADSPLDAHEAEAAESTANNPQDAGAASTAAAANSQIIKLTPQNTQIQFVGTHTGDEPRPRTGVFTEFAGEAAVEKESGLPQSVWVDIQVKSLETPIQKLTNHLKSPDFFDEKEYPTAKFKSTSISPQEGSDEHLVTGKLTLMEATKEISFPARITMSDGELKLKGGLTIKRTEYGMDKMLDGVNDEVEISVAIGQPTTVPTR